VGLNVTVIESGAALDNLRKLKAGAFDFALSIDIPSAMQMYHGIDAFKGQPWKDVRALFIRNVTRIGSTSGRLRIKTFAELSGKRFSPGIPGSSSAANIVKFNDILKRNRSHARCPGRCDRRVENGQDRGLAEDQSSEMPLTLLSSK